MFVVFCYSIEAEFFFNFDLVFQPHSGDVYRGFVHMMQLVIGYYICPTPTYFLMIATVTGSVIEE